MKRPLLRVAVVTALFIGRLGAMPARAQTSTPEHVYAGAGSGVNGFTETSGTGALSIVTGSPFTGRGGATAVAVDALGRFLFTVSGNEVSMFQIDSSTGGLSEVTTSPFAAPAESSSLPAPATAVALATEPTGQYLYVGYQSGSVMATTSAVIPYVIDAVHLALVPLPSFEVDQTQEITPEGNPHNLFAMATDLRGRNLYVAFGFGGTEAGIAVYAINAGSGALTDSNDDPTIGSVGYSMTLDPLARFIYLGGGTNEGVIEGYPLSPVDSLPELTNDVRWVGSIAAHTTSMAIESSGAYLYALSSGFHIFSIDATTGDLTEVSGSPQTISPSPQFLAADTQGPYLYALSGGQIYGYQINLQTGLVTAIAGSPFGGAVGGNGSVAFTGANPVSPITGPYPQFDSTSLSFPNILVGFTSGSLTDRMVNNGGQALLISNISVAGANPGDFAESNNCPVSLGMNTYCTISVFFQPTAAGARQATVVIADNGPGNSQSITLSGTGLPDLPAVTFVPASLQFPTILAGASSGPETMQVTNSGNAPLVFATSSIVVLSGPNTGDFTLNGTTCTGTLAVNASCTVSVTFVPAAAGQRTAAVSLNDNAPSSPQSFTVTGAATLPYTITPTISGSSSATVTAGATAQYNLQISPASGFSGPVNLQCSGAPQGSTCSVPATIQVTGGNAAVLVSITTTARSETAPPGDRGPAIPPANPGIVFLTALIALLGALLAMIAFDHHAALGRRKLPSWGTIAICAALLLTLSLAGCGAGGGSSSTSSSSNNSGGSSGGSSGGGSSTTGTPAGNYTVTITATSGKVVETYPLTLTVQ